MTSIRTALIVAATVAAALPAQSPAGNGTRTPLRLRPVAAFTSPTTTSAFECRDLDGDGAAELVLVERDGTVRVLALGDDGALAPVGAPLKLLAPTRSLLALADMVGDAKLELVVLSSSGTDAYPLAAGSGFATEPVSLTTTGRLGFRAGPARFVDFVQDVNADGAPDLVVPTGRNFELWLRTNGDGGARYDLAQTLPIDFDHSMWADADELTDEMRNRIRIPRLDIADLNGDGRPDLRVEDGDQRLFYLQRADGRFADEPIRVDLTIFQDTTPKADVRMGETLVLSDRQQFQSGDLDGDGIPDHVIAHRRKVWTFRSSKAGPQFTDAHTRMVAEDISGMLLLHLDDDDRKDLVVFKVDVPTAGALVLGLVSNIDIAITVLGYRTDANGDFESKAAWRRELTLRAPSLLSLLSKAEDLVTRFTELLSKLRWSTIADFDGDGQRDLTLIGEDGTSVELWLEPRGGKRSERAFERWVRELLFENPDTLFDLDRLFRLAAQVFDSRTSTLTGERASDAKDTFAPRADRFIVDLRSADLDGDGRAELIVVDDDTNAPNHLGFVVLRWTDSE